MFKKGEYIVYGMNGPCYIEDITRLHMTGCDAQRKYYVLRPVNAGKSVIYSPVDNQKVTIRRVLSRQEAEGLLSEIEDIEEIRIECEKLREDQYKEILRDTDLRRWVGMLKTLFRKRRDRIAQGRKFTTVDEKYLKETCDLLGSELSIALGEDMETARGRLYSSMEVKA